MAKPKQEQDLRTHRHHISCFRPQTIDTSTMVPPNGHFYLHISLTNLSFFHTLNDLPWGNHDTTSSKPSLSLSARIWCKRRGNISIFGILGLRPVSSVMIKSVKCKTLLPRAWCYYKLLYSSRGCWVLLHNIYYVHRRSQIADIALWKRRSFRRSFLAANPQNMS